MGLSAEEITRVALEILHISTPNNEGNNSTSSSSSVDPNYQCPQSMWACLVGVAIGWTGLYVIHRSDVTAKGRFSYSITFASFALSMAFSIFMYCTNFNLIANIFSTTFVFSTELSLVFSALVDIGVLKERSRQFCWLSSITYLCFCGLWMIVSSFAYEWRVHMYIVVAVVSFMAFGMIEIVAILRQRTKKTVPQLTLLFLSGFCAFAGIIMWRQFAWLANVLVSCAMLDLLGFYLAKVRGDAEEAKETMLPLTSKVPPYIPQSIK